MSRERESKSGQQESIGHAVTTSQSHTIEHRVIEILRGLQRSCGNERVRSCGAEKVKSCGTEKIISCDAEKVMSCRTEKVRSCGTEKVRSFGTENVRSCGTEKVRSCGPAILRRSCTAVLRSGPAVHAVLRSSPTRRRKRVLLHNHSPALRQRQRKLMDKVAI